MKSNIIISQDTANTIILINSKKHGNFNCIVDTEDYFKIKNYLWHVTKYRNNYYAYSSKIHKSMHHYIVKTKKIIDHINHNTLDNRKNNLRVCTRKENSRNSLKHKDGLFIYKGVTRESDRYKIKRFKARIVVNGKTIHLGLFENIIDAAKAYNQAAIKYFGEFANINKV